MLSLGHQVVVLPLCAIGWVLGLFNDAPALIYLLTGAYLTSDSIINYTPVSNCVTGEEGPPAFSWGVHAHHFFTVVLCALGTTLPPWPVREGAICILLGEVREARGRARRPSTLDRSIVPGAASLLGRRMAARPHAGTLARAHAARPHDRTPHACPFPARARREGACGSQ